MGAACEMSSKKGMVFMPGNDMPVTQGRHDFYCIELPHESLAGHAFLEHPAGRNICRLFVSQASTCFSLPRLGSSKSWLRQLCFGAYRKVARKPLMRHLIVVLGLALHVYRCSLARARGLFHPRQLLPRCKGTARKFVSKRSGVAQSISGPAL